MVRDLPMLSDFLISVVCRRVSVIFCFASLPPCDLRRCSSSWVLSFSVSGVSSASALFTPAACSCSISSAVGSPSCWASCVTLICAMGFRGLGARFGEPRGACRHDELLGALIVQTRQLGQVVGCEVGEGLLGAHALRGKQARGLVVHALDLQQVLD